MFNIVDIITGIYDSKKQYYITNDDAVMEVVEMSPAGYPDGYLSVRLLTTSNMCNASCVGAYFQIQEEYFELVDKSAPTTANTAIERKIAFMRKRFEGRNK